MPGTDPSWSAALQGVVAGVVVCLCAMHSGWLRADLHPESLSERRGERGRSRAHWTLVWSLALAAVTLLNALVALVPTGPGADVLLLLRFVALGTAVTLSWPAVQTFTDGPGVHRQAAASAAWYIAATALWLGSDVLDGPAGPGALHAHGPLATAVDLVPVTALVLYVAVAVRRITLSRVGVLVTASGLASAVLLVTASAAPAAPSTDILKGLWVVPLAIGLQVLAAARIAAVRGEWLRRARMRDAVARVADAAWNPGPPERVLDRARAECRAVLGDQTMDAELRRLPRDRFVTEFTSTSGGVPDADERAFLRDLDRVVSGAAERAALTRRLDRVTSIDGLTGLHSRSALDQYLATALANGAAGTSPVVVLFCDLDGFKQVNDRHGHLVGDQVLVSAAEHLTAVLGDAVFVARHGGDEFVAVLEGGPGPGDAAVLARRIRDEFVASCDGRSQPSVSVGIATWHPGDAEDAEALVRDADLAMLEAKQSHLGVKVFNERLRAQVTSRATVRAELEHALETGEILAHFQPLTDAMTLEIVGLEVLARWQHEGRLRRPSEWLPLAEETGLIIEVGRQMFVAARAGMEEFDLPVAVNVAARQLDERDFVRHVEESWGTDRWDRLTIEVTESALLYDAVHVRSSLALLAARGVKISLDDFGTGYNSLSRLGELPLHSLKIDQAFVHDIGTHEGAAVVRTILALAEAHGLEVVAEGVERAVQLTALVRMGVGTVQGYMLGRPSATVPHRTRRGDVPRQVGPLLRPTPHVAVV